jgi:hypothetical protein
MSRSSSAWPTWTSRPAKAEQEALIERLTKEIQIRNTGRDNLYTLAFRDSDQDKAKRVIQSLVSIFVESSLGASRKDTDSAKTFLNEQIKQYEAKLEEAETRLKEFRLRNLDMQAADGKDMPRAWPTSGASSSRPSLSCARPRTHATRPSSSWRCMRRAGRAVRAAQSLLQESTINGRHAGDRLRASMHRSATSIRCCSATPMQHPDIVSTRKLLKELEEQKRKEAAELRKAAWPPRPRRRPCHRQHVAWRPGAQSPAGRCRGAGGVAEGAGGRVHRALRSRPRFVEDGAADRSRSRPAQPRLRDHQEELRGPGVPQAVCRDVGRTDVASGVADFRLIDPPRVTPKPVSPNRLALLPMALVAAILIGLAVSFVASQMRPVFSDANELRN